MKMNSSRYQLELRAADALKSALGEVSTIKVREIRHEPSQLGSDSNLMVHVDLFGRRHTLTCEIHSVGEPQQLRSTLNGLRNASHHEDTMPIIIAPYLSPEAQTLCKEHKTGFVDLQGNARLALGEVFIVKRTLPNNDQPPVSAVKRHSTAQQKAAVHAGTKRQDIAVMQVAMA